MEKEWEHEPDRLEGDYKGLKLLILRAERMGHLCGYVGITKEHPLYGNNYGDSDFPDLKVHGGVTFSEEGDGERWPKDYWWIGFDCAHAWDDSPGLIKHKDATYKNIYYVLREVIILADQLLERKT